MKKSSKASIVFAFLMAGMVGVIVLEVVLMQRSCNETRQRCHQRAMVKGKVELNCQDVQLKNIGRDVIVVGCGKNITYECDFGTPRKEGTRTEERRMEDD